MQQVELTVVVTVHAEDRLLRPTLRSVDAAIARVLAGGATAELLIVADTATARTRELAAQWAADSHAYVVRLLETTLRESGAARNAGAADARGTFVAFIDGDDLVSENYLSASLDLLRTEGDDVIAHPEYVLSFGARSLLWRTDSASRDRIDYRDLVRHNLWPASSIARRSVYLGHPYRSLPPESGFGPEDWIWNIDTTAAGIRHESVADTVFLYRVKDSGGVNERHRSSILPAFDLDALRRALPLHAPEEDAPRTPSQRVRNGARRAYARALPLVRRATFWLSWEVKHQMYRAARWSYRITTRSHRADPAVHETPAPVLDAMLRAAELEPAISWTAHDYARLPIWRARDDGYAHILENIIDDVGERGKALVLAPWIGIGGADTVALNYAKALQSSDRFAGATAIIGTFLPERTVHEIIPGSLRYVQIWDRWLQLPPHLRRRLIAQALVLLDPDVVISVNSFHFTEAMREYGPQIARSMKTFATLFAFDRIGAGYPTNPITDDAQRGYLDDMSGLITDNTHTAALIDDILALPSRQVLVHPQPVSEKQLPLPRGTRAYNNVYFSERNPFRIVWPHRLDKEKRPDALIPLAQELRRRGLPVTIDVWGQYVLHGDEDSLLTRFEEAGVVYRGPYSGGLPALQTYDYHALLLTSESEGMPLVLVQSLLLGLPVVVSGVGGVSDLIVHEHTGMVAAGPSDTEGFADAIERLMRSRDLRRTVIEEGHATASRRHSWEAFQATVDAALS